MGLAVARVEVGSKRRGERGELARDRIVLMSPRLKPGHQRTEPRGANLQLTPIRMQPVSHRTKQASYRL